MRITRPLTAVGFIVGLSLLTTACGDDAARPAAEAAPETTVAEQAVEPAAESMEEPGAEPADVTAYEPASDPIDATEEEPAAEPVPQAIISLSPTSTEMLYAIGAGDQVLAVDDFSNYPPDAAEKMQGLSGYTPNVEAIVGLEPDLVITDGTNADLISQLEALGVPHWEGYAALSFDDVYAEIEQLGAVTGNVGEAAELVGQMQADVEDIKAGLPDLDEPLTYYHELDNTFFSVTSDTFIGAVYAEIGLVNIADAVGDGNPYPQLSAEFILSEDPDLIFLACTKYCGETAESVAVRDGWDTLTAVRTGGVIPLDDDVASRWGPRIVDLLRAAGQAVGDVAAQQPAN